MTFDWKNLIQIAINAMVNGAATTLGVWMVSRHLINRMDSKRDGKKDGDGKKFDK